MPEHEPEAVYMAICKVQKPKWEILQTDVQGSSNPGDGSDGPASVSPLDQ
jgi:hypothetical protein